MESRMILNPILFFISLFLGVLSIYKNTIQSILASLWVQSWDLLVCPILAKADEWEQPQWICYLERNVLKASFL